MRLLIYILVFATCIRTSSLLLFKYDVDTDTSRTHHKQNTQKQHKVRQWVANSFDNRCWLRCNSIVLLVINLVDLKSDIIEGVIFTRLCFSILNWLTVFETTFHVFPWSLLLTFFIPDSNTNTAQILIRVTSGWQILRQFDFNRVIVTRTEQPRITSNLFERKEVDALLGIAWVPETFGIVRLIALGQSLDMLVLVDLSEWLLVVPFEVQAVGLRVACWHVLLVEMQWREVQIIHLILEVVHSRVLRLAYLWWGFAAEFCREGRFLFSFVHNVHVEFLQLTRDQTIRHFYAIECWHCFPLHCITLFIFIGRSNLIIKINICNPHVTSYSEGEKCCNDCDDCESD